MPANLWPIFQDIVGAGTTPNANPYYGAQLLTPDDHPSIKQPTWVDATGQPITDASHIAQLQKTPQLANEPWVSPGFFSRLGTTGRDENLANMAALQYPGQQAQLLAAQERQSRGMAGTETGNLIGRMNAFSQLPNNVLGAGAYLGVGNGANLNAFNEAAARQLQGTPSAEAAAASALAQHNAATVPQAANPDISSAALTQAQIAAQTTPLIGRNQMWQAMYGDPMSQYRGYQENANFPLGGGNPRILHMNPDGTTSVMPNPTTSYQNMMMQNALGQGGGMGSVGAKYGLPPVQNTSSPFNVPGIQGAPQPQPTIGQQAAPFTPPLKEGDIAKQSGITPVNGTDYGFDADGNVYYMPTGEFVPPENIKNTAIGKAVQHSISVHKAIESDRKNQVLPHGIIHNIGTALYNTYIPHGQVFTSEFEKNHPTISGLIGHPVQTIRGY